jgi:hypothetical protein
LRFYGKLARGDRASSAMISACDWFAGNCLAVSSARLSERERQCGGPQ